MTDNSWKVGDRAERLEDHPLVKAGEVHEVTEMFRGGYLGFRRPVGGEWNPSGWRKVTAADDRGDGNEAEGVVTSDHIPDASKMVPDELAIAVERLTKASAPSPSITGLEFDVSVTAADLRLILSRLASQEETIRADGEARERAAKAELARELLDEGRVHPANRLVNVRRRAGRARASAITCVTCPASRHVAMMADCLSTHGYYHMLSEEPLHCATGMYSVVESLWKARAEIARLSARQEGGLG